MTQIDLREGLLRNLAKADKVSMDRIFLLFKRYNTSEDDLLRFNEFCQIICPVDGKDANTLHSRGNASIDEKHVINHFMKVLEEAIQVEVNFEAIRQKLRERKEFDVGKAFLTMAAEQRLASSSLIKFVTPGDIAQLMRKHDHLDDLQPLDISLLMSRFDLDMDGRICVNEFY